jgi:hypothetical protein
MGVMAIQIPKLAGTGCEYLTVCGDVDKGNQAAIDYLRKQDKKWQHFRIVSEDAPIFVRVGFGHSKGTHCHIDVATPEAFGRGKPSVTVRGEVEFQEAMKPLEGAKIIRLGVTGHIKVTLPESHSFVQSARKVLFERDGVAIRMTGHSFSLTGSPVHSISFKVDEVKSVAKLTVEADIDESVIGEPYLIEAFRAVCVPLKTLTGKEVPHADL